MDNRQDDLQEPTPVQGDAGLPTPKEPDILTEVREEREHKGESGSKNVLIIVVLAIIIVVLALLYLWGSQLERVGESAVPVNVEPVGIEEEDEVPMVPGDENTQVAPVDVRALPDDAALQALDAEVASMEEELSEIDAVLDELDGALEGL
jgi:flagellar basal body-associated protein FliL